MKIAIACDGKEVSAHFGHCEEYALYEATDSIIAYTKTLKSPGMNLENFLSFWQKTE